MSPRRSEQTSDRIVGSNPWANWATVATSACRRLTTRWLALSTAFCGVTFSDTSSLGCSATERQLEDTATVPIGRVARRMSSDARSSGADAQLTALPMRQEPGGARTIWHAIFGTERVIVEGRASPTRSEALPSVAGSSSPPRGVRAGGCSGARVARRARREAAKTGAGPLDLLSCRVQQGESQQRSCVRGGTGPSS